MALLIDHIEGAWIFDPAGTGTRVTWRWILYPKSVLSAPALPVFARLWRGTPAGRWSRSRTTWSVESIVRLLPVAALRIFVGPAMPTFRPACRTQRGLRDVLAARRPG